MKKERLILPALLDKCSLRPGPIDIKQAHYVPDETYDEFWEHFYGYLKSNFVFQDPVGGMKGLLLNDSSGFGKRTNPKTDKNEFHGGVDVGLNSDRSIKPFFDGVLEYAGYHFVDGDYVMMSHPKVTTEDNLVLFSLYIHVKEYFVGFSKYQKMLRGISLNQYPQIEIGKDQRIAEGFMFDSTTLKHLHLQLEFRHKSKPISVLIDPLKLFG